MLNFFWLIPFFPFLGSIINGLFGSIIYKRYGEKGINSIAITAVSLSFLTALLSFIELITKSPESRLFISNLFTWITTPPFTIDFALRFDVLSATMVLVVTLVGGLIHIYSIGYMHQDKGYSRYFSYLNLFMFAMLTLVLADNLLVMFIGWEGVGLCSYLLIGFWFTDQEKAKAGMKAFVLNRIGDAAFLIGITMAFWANPSNLSFSKMATQDLSGIASVLAILFFIGAVGKSAQVPLYVWLPDAMAGPTPVSALIHAATMVTAGVYMVARLNFIYSVSPIAQIIVSGIGILTAFFAATIALTQYDFKRILAYSTISQLGYMFVGVGLYGYSAGIFHLVTHAFFKALLFLGAGTVLHSLEGEQDIRRMGGLSSKLPHTYRTFLVACLAIAGIPPFAGFFSKDGILGIALTTETHLIPFWSKLVWVIGVLTAFLTAFYIFRLFYYVFFAEPRVHKVHKEPKVMTIPLYILAGFSIFIGFIGMPRFLGLPNLFENFLGPIFETRGNVALGLVPNKSEHHPIIIELFGMILTVSVGLFGLLLAQKFYKVSKSAWLEKMKIQAHGLYNLLYNKYFVDEFYNKTFVQGTVRFSKLARIFDNEVIDRLVNLFVPGTVRFSKLARIFDNEVIDRLVNLSAWATVLISFLSGIFDGRVIDGLVNLIGRITRYFGRIVQKFQTGKIEQYIYGLLGGALIIMVLWLIFKKGV